MTPKSASNGTAVRRLTGSKAILRYLAERHALVICRQTLHRLRTVPGSGIGRLGTAVGPDPFPAESIPEGRTVTLVANTDAVDRWVSRHRAK